MLTIRTNVWSQLRVYTFQMKVGKNGRWMAWIVKAILHLFENMWTVTEVEWVTWRDKMSLTIWGRYFMVQNLFAKVLNLVFVPKSMHAEYTLRFGNNKGWNNCASLFIKILMKWILKQEKMGYYNFSFCRISEEHWIETWFLDSDCYFEDAWDCTIKTYL